MNRYTSQNVKLYAPATDAGGAGGAGGAAPAGAPSAPAAGGQSAEDFYNDTPEPAGGTESAPAAGEEGGENFGDQGDSPQPGQEGAGGVEGQEPAAPPVAAPAAQPTLRLDPESIAALRAGMAPPQRGPEAPRFTNEQLKAMLNPVEVTPQLLGSLGFTEASPEQVQGFQVFANMIVKNAVSVAKVMIDRKEAEFQERLGPISEQQAKALAEQTRGEFFTAHPHLTKYQKLVKLAAQEVNPEFPDGSPKSREQIFKEVAQITEREATSFGIVLNKPTANLGAGVGRPVPQPNMPGTPGRSGGDNHSARGKPNDADADIYRRQ